MNALSPGFAGMRLSGAGGGKSGGSSGGVEAPNTLRSDAVVRVIDVLSEGPISGLATTLPGQSIFFNDTPLQDVNGKMNFEGVSYALRVGTPSQAPVSGYPAVENTSVLGYAVGYGTTTPLAPVVTITNTADTSVLFTITIGALYAMDTSNGNMNDNSVALEIQVQPNGAVWETVVQDTISGKCVSSYQRTYKIPIPTGTAFPIQLRVLRLSPDDPNSASVSAFEWTSITEQIEHQLIYMDTAYVALTVDATAFSGSIPVRTYEVKGIEIRVPANYNPVTRVYATTGIGTSAGSWDGATFQVAWSNNPAWILYDLLTNTRYGLGDVISESYCDVWSLYVIGQYCDGLVDNGAGGTEPRYTFNGVINTIGDAYKVVQSIASSFAGMTYWGAGQIVVVQDAPANNQKLFTESNVIDGIFSYEGTSLNARHSMCAVQWLDPSNAYRPTIDVVTDPQMIQLLGVRRKDVTGLGITSRGQAIRFARWVLDSEKYATETVTFKAGIHDCDVRPGMVVAVQDAHYAGIRNGGRTIAPPEAHAVPRSNLVANGDATGAVGSANTLPTGWSIVNSGSAVVQVVGTNISDSGIGFVDLQISSTGAAAMTLDIDTCGTPLPLISVTPGTIYTASAYLNLMYGSTAGLTSLVIEGRTFNGGTATVGSTDDMRGQILGGYARGNSVVTAGASNTNGGTRIAMAAPAGTAFSFVLRVGGIQFETGAVPTSYLSTSGTPTTVYGPSTTVVALDGPVTILAGYAYTLLITDISGNVQAGTVSNGAGTYSDLTLTAALPSAPPPGSVWILTSSQIAPRPFRVLAVSEAQKNVYEVTGLLYDPGKYARVDSGIPSKDVNYSDLLPAPSSPIPAPLQVVALEYVTGLGTTTVDTVTISWSITPDARITGYELQVLAADGATILQDLYPTGLSIDLTNLALKSYFFRVRSTTISNAFSAWTTTALFAVTGQTTPPNGTSAMTCQPLFLANALTWANPPDRLLKWVELWRSTDNVLAHASLIQAVTAAAYTDTGLNSLVTYFYWTRVVDTTGATSYFTGPVSGQPQLITGADMGQNILTIENFVAGLTAVAVWTGAALPVNPAAVNNAVVIVWETDFQLYRWNATTQTWTTSVSASALLSAIPGSTVSGTTGGLTLPGSAISGTLSNSTLNASQILGQLAAASIIEPGTITQTLLQVGDANNVFWNSTFTLTMAGWLNATSAGSGVVPVMAPVPSSSPYYMGTGAAQLACTAVTASHFSDLVWAPGGATSVSYNAQTPVVAGQAYQFQAKLISDTANIECQIYVLWYTSAGAYISNNNSPLVTLSATNPPATYADWTQMGLIGTAPATAGIAALVIRVFNNTGGTASYNTYVSQALFGPTSTNASVISPWTAGGVTQIAGGQIISNSITAQQILAGTITATQISANAIGTAQLTVGFGTNVISNPSMQVSSFGWSPSSSGSPAGLGLNQASQSGFYSPAEGAGALSAVSLPVGSTFSAWWQPVGSSYGIACVPGTTLEAQAKLGANRCCCRVQIAFYTASGTLVSTASGNRVVASSGATLSTFTLSDVIAIVPATAATALMLVEAYNDGGSDFAEVGAGALAAGNNIYVWFCQASLGLTVAGATQTQPYAPGGVTSIQGGMLAANSITANAIAAGTITATQIQAGSITTTQLATGTLSASNITSGTISAGFVGSFLGAFNTVQITNAQIANLTVTTSLIAPSALSNAFVASIYNNSGNGTAISSSSAITVPSGGIVLVLMNAWVNNFGITTDDNGNITADSATFTWYRNGAQIGTFNLGWPPGVSGQNTGSYFSQSLSFTDVPGAGVFTYEVWCSGCPAPIFEGYTPYVYATVSGVVLKK